MLKPQILTPLLLLALGLPALSQDSQEREPIANANETPPVYRVNVVERTTKAIDYGRKGKKVDVDLVGTSLMPEAHGRARVEPRTGRTKIDVDFRNMKPAQNFGPQYLTYVLWAITPEGRPQNLGEVVLKDKKDKDSDLHVSSNLQSFGMIVTAEPYFAVTRPSDVVVMENQVSPNLKADVRPIATHYEALNRNEYSVDINPSELPATSADEKMPLELLEAENAVAIAKASGASQYAAPSLQKAQDALNQAQNAYRQKRKASEIGPPARRAAESAEDARVITIRAKRQEQLAEERRQAQKRTEEARARADAETQRAEQARIESDRQAQQRQQAEQARQQAELAAQRATAEQQQAEQARQQALAQQQQLAQQTQQAQMQAQQSEQARQQAELNAQQTRQRLLDQLNSVLQTRESARGLIVNMNDVLFDTGKATLKPGAQVRLAKVAGIVMAYPDLKLDVQGFTDNVGGEEYNQQLSERRADAVRAFLVSQGVPSANIVSQGFGKSQPIATNSTSAGRQMNRRVELVVSGNAIGSVPSRQTTVGENDRNVTPNTQTSTPGIAAPAKNPPPDAPR